MNIDIQLCALDPEMVDAWSEHFDSVSGVSLYETNILSKSADAILSPANSFGFMDGGIDLAYSNHFGWELQERVQHSIRESHSGELPIGCALIVPTGHKTIPNLVSTPTMRVPSDIAETVNVYLAFRAALLAIKQSRKIRSLLSPALGTGIGGMPFKRAARQMHAAYAEVVLGQTEWRSTAHGILRHHAGLLS
jgi:O-acetyl-ADP-ribose deacetylase (regulator of RNase III)